MKAPRRPHPAIAVDGWNQEHEVGVAVFYRKDNGSGVATTTRTEASILGGHTAVIWLDGVSGCVALDRVSPITAERASYSLQAEFKRRLEAEGLDSTKAAILSIYMVKAGGKWISPEDRAGGCAQ